MAQKGISLPIEMIIVIAIAVLVLVVLAAFFLTGTRPFATISDEAAYSQGCINLRFSKNCVGTTEFVIQDYHLPDGTIGKLTDACKKLGRGTDPATCKAACGCTSGTPTP